MRWDPGVGAFRPLMAFDAADYAAHLARLPEADLRARFRRAMPPKALKAHAVAQLSGAAHVIGWFHDGRLRGAAEVTLGNDGQIAEAAFEVEPDWRGRGIGSEMIMRCLLWARNRGAKRLEIYTERGNIPMLRAARRNGAMFTFDLNDAEGAIAAKRPSLLSHLREVEADELGWMRWGAQRAAAWTRRINPWLAPWLEPHRPTR